MGWRQRGRSKALRERRLSGKPIWSRRRVHARKTEIVLEAAQEAFLEAGYVNTSRDAVAERAGVSKHTVYSNFKN
jgi:TetR/AcrR family transcriptional repressor of mexJK operon